MFFTSSLLWAIEQKPLSISLPVRSMRELPLRGTLFVFFLAITIFSSPPMQDLVGGYLGNYCGFTLWCS